MSIEMLTLKAVSPLALHRRRTSEQFSPTLDYIPGSTVRGALADVYLQGDAKRANESLFQDLFVSDRVHFSDFLPSNGRGRDRTQLLPATAVACKRFADEHRAGWSDAVLRLELLREWDSPDLAQHNRWKRCPDCQAQGYDGKRDRWEQGYYTSVEQLDLIKVRQRMIAGSAIERATGTAAHAMLFSHEVIEESGAFEDQDVFFRGTVTLPDELRSALQDLAPAQQRLAVGYGRSRGLGQVQVADWTAPRSEPHGLRERWAALNEAVRQLWQAYERPAPGQYFSLTLQSHLALRDEAGQPVLGQIQAAQLNLPDGAERCRCIVNAVVVPGWNAAQEKPKADVWAIGRGSVLLFRVSHDVDPAPILRRLEAIERDGVGDHLAEGCGRIIACDPFHYHFTLRELTGGVQ
jgi:CRISPR-associated protein Csx10